MNDDAKHDLKHCQSEKTNSIFKLGSNGYGYTCQLKNNKIEKPNCITVILHGYLATQIESTNIVLLAIDIPLNVRDIAVSIFRHLKLRAIGLKILHIK